MMPQLAEKLRPAVALRGPDAPLFDAPPDYRAFRRDLARAKIERVRNGEHIAFHSFRYFFATEMSKHLPMTKVQLLMRHKSLKLTADLYRKLHLTDTDDVWKVPNLH